MFVWIVISSFVSGGAYSVCAPMLPPELEKKDITGFLVGIIFAMYSVGSILWAPVVGKYLIGKVGAKNLLGLSIGVMGWLFIMFGQIEVIESRRNVTILASVIRFAQGITGTTHWTTCLSLVSTIATPEKKEKMLGINTGIWGLGMLAGPLIGSALYSLLGFKIMCFFYGCVQMLLAIFIRVGLLEKKSHIQES